MGHPHIVPFVSGGGRPRGRAFRQPVPPPPVLVPQEFVGPAPSESTIIRLSRATNAERTFLARKVADRFLGYKPAANQPDERNTVEAVTAFFLAVVAIRAGMKQRGRNSGDEKVLRDMQRILVDCITHENAYYAAAMMSAITVDHLGATADDRRATARPVMAQILAHGFVAVVPEIRTIEKDGVLVVATAARGDPDRNGWTTVYNMRIPANMPAPPAGATVLLPYPLPRPIESDGAQRHATCIDVQWLLFIDPTFLR